MLSQKLIVSVLISAVCAVPLPQSAIVTSFSDISLNSSFPTASDSAANVGTVVPTSSILSTLASANATAVGVSTLATETAPPSGTDTSLPLVVTDSSTLNSTTTDATIAATDSSGATITTDTSLPTATDTSDTDDSDDGDTEGDAPDDDGDDSNGDDSGSVTDGPSATSASAAASATPSGLSFAIPVVPSACAVLPSDPPFSIPTLNTSFTLASAPMASTLAVNTSSSLSFASTTLTAAVSTNTSAVGSTLPSTDASSNGLFSVASNATSISTSIISLVPTSTDSAVIAAVTDSPDVNDTIASPIIRRIAQADLPAVAQSWQDLCLVSGGDIFTNEPCVTLAGINGINALLASADPCDQQDNADAMIDFAKSSGVTNADALITNAVAYRQHPRNALNINGVIPSTPYCQRAPRNPELAGVVNAQLDGVNPGVFGGPTVGLVAFGDASTCPLGTTPDVTTCGCS